MRNTFAQTQARLFAGPPTVYVRIAVAFVLIVATGGLRPPLLYALRTFAGEKTIFAMHKRTPTKSGGRETAVVR
jgi:hypothetical protein